MADFAFALAPLVDNTATFAPDVILALGQQQPVGNPKIFPIT